MKLFIAFTLTVMSMTSAKAQVKPQCILGTETFFFDDLNEETHAFNPEFVSQLSALANSKGYKFVAIPSREISKKTRIQISNQGGYEIAINNNYSHLNVEIENKQNVVEDLQKGILPKQLKLSPGQIKEETFVSTMAFVMGPMRRQGPYLTHSWSKAYIASNNLNPSEVQADLQSFEVSLNRYLASKKAKRDFNAVKEEIYFDNNDKQEYPEMYLKLRNAFEDVHGVNTQQRLIWSAFSKLPLCSSEILKQNPKLLITDVEYY